MTMEQIASQHHDDVLIVLMIMMRERRGSIRESVIEASWFGRNAGQQ